MNYIYPQALAKQLAPYSNTSAWANHDIAIEINHDMYMNSINYEKAYNEGWNNTGVPPGGLYYFQASITEIFENRHALFAMCNTYLDLECIKQVY